MSMPPLEGPEAVANGRRVLGWVVSGLFALYPVLNGVAHILRPQPVADAFAKLGVPLHDSLVLGVVVLFRVLLYLMSKTPVAGALLLTGYLGGAVAIHMRVADGAFPLLFPVLIGAGLWVGLGLRNPVLVRLLTGTE